MEGESSQDEAPRGKGAQDLREEIVKILIGDIDKLLAKVEGLNKTFSNDLRAVSLSTLKQLKEAAAETVGQLNHEKGQLKKAGEAGIHEVHTLVDEVKQLLASTPPALRSRWWSGFFAGALGGLVLGLICCATAIFILIP